MATLDEKYLDGPNVGYCSDSDEDIQPDPANFSDIPPPSSAVGSGKAGAKGVLADYRAFKELSRQKDLLAHKNLIKEAQRFNLTSSEHPMNEQSDEDDEEDELEAIRRRRLELMQNRNKAKITEITSKDQFLQTIEATTDGARAVFHIYRDDMEVSETLNEALLDLAAQTRRCGFYKVQPKILDMSSRFNKTALPALQIYENEELIGNFVKVTDTLGEDFDSRDLKRYLAENDITFESRN